MIGKFFDRILFVNQFYFSLTAYTMREGTQQNIPENIQLFDIFSEQISEVVKVIFNFFVIVFYGN